MKSRLFNRRSLLPLVAALLLISSLLPARAANFFSKVPAGILNPALALVCRPLHSLSVTMRGGRDNTPRENQVSLVETNEQAEARYRRLEIELEEAKRTIAELEDLQRLLPLSGIKTFSAPVTRTKPESDSPTIHLNISGVEGIKTGQVVTSGVDLVGRIARVEVMVSAEASLITQRGRTLQVRIVPRRLDEPRRSEPILVRYEPKIGGFTAVVSIIDEKLVQAGDEAILDDPDWPGRSRGLIVGTVTSLERLPQDPQRRATLVIKPRKDLLRLSRVTVIVPTEGQ